MKSNKIKFCCCCCSQLFGKNNKTKKISIKFLYLYMQISSYLTTQSKRTFLVVVLRLWWWWWWWWNQFLIHIYIRDSMIFWKRLSFSTTKQSLVSFVVCLTYRPLKETSHAQPHSPLDWCCYFHAPKQQQTHLLEAERVE